MDLNRSKNFWVSSRAGMTLVEMIVVIAAILVLLCLVGGIIMLPNIMGHSQRSSVMNSGKRLYAGIQAWSLDHSTPGWPQRMGRLDGREEVMSFPNSTAYFAWVVTNQVLDVDFSFFAAPGIKEMESTNPKRFRAENNAWAVAVGVDSNTGKDVPVLWTANISRHPGTFSPLQSIDQVPYLVPDVRPFGDSIAILIENGGAAASLKTINLTPERFNPSGATNACLYPSRR